MKKILIIVAVGLLLTGCFGKKDKAKETKVEEPKVVETEDKVEKEKVEMKEIEPEIEEKPEEPKLPLDTIKSDIEGQIKDFAEVTIDEDENTLNLKPIGEAEKYLKDVNKSAKNPILRRVWSMMVDKLAEQGKEIKDNYGSGLKVNVLDPTNNDVLLTVEDGVVTYDKLEEIRNK